MFESSDMGGSSASVLIGVIQAAHRAAAAAQATEILAMATLHQRRCGADAEYSAAETALAVGSTEAAAASLIGIGVALQTGLPATRAAFMAGRIDLAHVRVIAEVTDEVPADRKDELEQRLAAAAENANPAALRHTARRWASRADAAGAQQRRAAREAGRSISVRGTRDGMAVIDAHVPAAIAQTLSSRLRELSLQVCKHDPRTKMQRRVDAIAAIANGSGRLRCHCGRAQKCPAVGPAETPREALLHVGISAESLAGLRADPGYLAGHGPIDPALARDIARQARVRIVCEGAAEDNRGGSMCRFPGCQTPVLTDLRTGSAPPMSAVPAPRLCHHHLQLRNRISEGVAQWSVRQCDATLEWTTPAGHTVAAPDEDLAYLFPAEGSGLAAHPVVHQ